MYLVFNLLMLGIDWQTEMNIMSIFALLISISIYLKQLEKHYTVRANHLLAGFPTNAKMRAQLIDWLVEVQVQFKLTQETFFLTVHTIDR